MINDQYRHIPSPLIMFTWTASLHDLQDCQMYNGVVLKGSKSMVNAGRPDRSNHPNYKFDSGPVACCCAATARKMLTSPGIAARYTLLMNTWNTLQESYQQRLDKNIHATVNHQIQQVENPIPARVISLDVGSIDNARYVDNLTSKGALERLQIGSTSPGIPTSHHCPVDKLHRRMPVCTWDYQDDADAMDKRNDIPTASRWKEPAIEL